MSDVTTLLGRRIAGKYLLEAHIGGGAMGEVYRARHATLDTLLAIKIMRHDIARDPSFRERFLREAKATSRLEHPNSVRVVDYGEDHDGLVYLAMEHLAGRDLLTLMKEDGPLPDDRIVDLLVQTLSAVGLAHSHGIVHRDLKPENIMVLASRDEDAPRDTVKVCDFGIAKLIDPRAFRDAADGQALTSSGAVVGTPEYMSPEQARGDGLDARSDIYSVGVILYQMLTGRVPFTAENALGVVLKQVIDLPRAPSELRPGLNPRLEAICLRALSKAPAQRYATAREMRGELRAAVATASTPWVGPDSDPNLASLPTARPYLVTPPPSPAVSYGSGGTQRLPAASAPRPAPSSGSGGAKSVAAVAVVALLVGGAAVAAVSLRARAPGKVATGLAQKAAHGAPSKPAAREEPEPDVPSVAPLPPASADGARLAPVAAVPVSSAPSSRAIVVTPPPVASAAPAVRPGPSIASAAPVVPAAPAEPFNPSSAFVGIVPGHAERVRPEAVLTMLRAASPEITQCYQASLRMNGAPVAGKAELSLSLDETGKVVAAIVSEPRLPSFGRCVQGALSGRKVSSVEGAATATQWLDLHP